MKKQLPLLKKLLEDEITSSQTHVIHLSQAIVLPILHNKDLIILQFYGWSINLHEDGTWIWEDTTGG